MLKFKAPAKRPRLRNILRHHSVACTLFTFFSIKERVTRLHVLNRMAQSKVYKHAMEPALRQACNQGLAAGDRVWLTLFRTKLYRVMKLNYHDFYRQQSENLEKLKFDAEIQKDLTRTLPNLAFY